MTQTRSTGAMLQEQCDTAAYEIISRILRENALTFSRPHFERNVIRECTEVLRALFHYEEGCANNVVSASPDVERCATDALDRVCTANLWEMPHRSYRETRSSLTLVPRTKTRTNGGRSRGISNHLKALRELEQPEQCTLKWYEMRNNLFTASNAWKALFSEASAFSLVREKVEAHISSLTSSVSISSLPNPSSRGSSDIADIDISMIKRVDVDLNAAIRTSMKRGDRCFGVCASEDSPLSWGKRYEPLSVMHYERKYGTVVQEYGCLVHKDYPFLGASPDGINYKRGSPLEGRMLEIKNVVSRVITGIPKEDYWIQMQLQMEVCDLNECDFFETRFREHTSYGDYVAEWNRLADPSAFGLIAAFFESAGSNDSEMRIHHEYAPLGLTLGEQDEWLERIRDKTESPRTVGVNGTIGISRTWHRVIYWQLVESSCVLVFRNRAWFAAAIAPLKTQWERVLYFRTHPDEWASLKEKRNAASTRRSRTAHASSSASSSTSALDGEEDAPSQVVCHLRLPHTKSS